MGQGHARVSPEPRSHPELPLFQAHILDLKGGSEWGSGPPRLRVVSAQCW